MHDLVRPCAALLVLLTALPLTEAQGDTGFLRGEGHFDSAYAYTLDYYDEFWVGDTSMSPAEVGEVERETASLYLAYGLYDDLDLVASANYVEAETDGTVAFEDQDDLQDLYLGAKWRAWSRNAGGVTFSALLAPSIKLPMTDYEDNDVTAIGDGQVDLRGRVIGHCQWSAFFLSLESGYDRRNGAPHDEVPLNVTLGATLAERLTLMPFFSMVRSQGGPDIGGGPFRAVEEEYERFGLSAYWRLTDAFGLTAMWRTTADGMNTGDADSLALGLVYGR
jgi:hypothetical protein